MSRNKPKKPPKLDILEVYGTTMGGLKPINIVQAAEEDFKRIERNEQRSADYEHFAFHRKHVHKAKTIVGLIRLALENREVGAGSGKKNTRLIYKDVETLSEALTLAISRPMVLKPGATEAEENSSTGVDGATGADL